MNKCSKVKNPCKICFETVTNKTGVQCKGACKKWVHYTCLSFTPGKIQDIKDGLITITCPCPNCNTRVPKEYLTNPPYTCTNRECPANVTPTCEIDECPINKQVVSRGASAYSGSSPCGPTCSASIKSSHYTPPVSSPKMTRIPPLSTPPKPAKSPKPPKATKSKQTIPQTPSISVTKDVPPCMSLPLMSQIASPPRTPLMVTSRSPSRKDVYTDNCSPSSEVRSQSCSCMSGRTEDMVDICETVDVGNQSSIRSNDRDTLVLKSGDFKASSSDSKITHTKENQKILLCTIHQLCSTVGHLSCQIKDLMAKMMIKIDKDC